MDRNFARILGIMLEAKLIWYKHYFLWCDEIIEQSENPPYWVIELATVKYLPSAIDIVKRYAFSQPREQFKDDHNDLYVACLLLRYVRREISWATFLQEAGDFTDGNEARKACEYFYTMLNQFEDADYSFEIEQSQKADVEIVFLSDVNKIHNYYDLFAPYYARYVRQKKDQ